MPAPPHCGNGPRGDGSRKPNYQREIIYLLHRGADRMSERTMQSIRGMFRSALLVFGVAAAVVSPAQTRRAAATGAHGASPRSSGSSRVSAQDPEGETLHAGIEPELRRLVADVLGVDPAELAPEASLTDDLAADSLDLVEVAIVLESAFDITLSPRRMDEVRSYRDLVDAVMASGERRGARELVLTPGLDVKSRLVPPGASEATLERAEALTVYAIETIRDDALCAGPGTHLEVTLPVGAGAADLMSVRDAFARLERHGIAVSVRRDVPTPRAIQLP